MKILSTLLALSAAVVAKKALVVIDVQSCFIEGGSLAVSGGKSLVPIINELREKYDGKLWEEVVISQDWHTKPHASFASAHNATPMSLKELSYNENNDLCKDGTVEKNINSSHIVDCTGCADANDKQCTIKLKLNQTMWPDHCLQNTDDAKFAPGLTIKDTDFIQQKGQLEWLDSYSAFYNNGNLISTGLSDHLKGKGVDTVFVVGIASDFCVKFSSLDAHSDNFKTYMVKDASKGINADLNPYYKEMADAGVSVITIEDLAGMVTASNDTTTAAAGSSTTAETSSAPHACPDVMLSVLSLFTAFLVIFP